MVEGGEWRPCGEVAMQFSRFWRERDAAWSCPRPVRALWASYGTFGEGREGERARGEGSCVWEELGGSWEGAGWEH